MTSAASSSAFFSRRLLRLPLLRRNLLSCTEVLRACVSVPCMLWDYPSSCKIDRNMRFTNAFEAKEDPTHTAVSPSPSPHCPFRVERASMRNHFGWGDRRGHRPDRSRLWPRAVLKGRILFRLVGRVQRGSLLTDRGRESALPRWTSVRP
ncbi:uncharacterized protein EV422DRAFT_548220 [Fimicolochytrium jonesii]|uniref:uncharacterized protein n=1 Tax=Fimicolochytrium jonesii TaxID=1396493 RepID=UPI0022FDD195|nr:uncharacterized protein EV422DRAFT_548220 [Fimicolochytrium jonesii]KAI8815740.1 hypothetical protein EV422DRAFT_548220 [Fimicolochytrium jonesii]